MSEENSKEVLISLNLSRVKNAPVPDRREIAIKKIREKTSKMFKGKTIIIGNDLNNYVNSKWRNVLKGSLKIKAVIDEESVTLRLPK